MSPTRRFPVLSIIGEAYADVRGDIPGLVRASGLWIALVIVCDAVVRFTGPDLSAIDPTSPPDQLPALPFHIGFALVAGGVIEFLGSFATAVYWHRRVLLHERVAGALAPLNVRVLHYFLRTIVVLMLMVGPPLLLGFIAPPLALLGVLSIFFAIRLSLVFPAAALDDDELTLRRSFELTRGNTARLFFGAVATTLPVVLAGALLQALVATLGGTGSLIGNAIATITVFVQTAIGTAFLSFSYRHFRQPNPVATR